jgi:hypothetical protein
LVRLTCFGFIDQHRAWIAGRIPSGDQEQARANVALSPTNSGVGVCVLQESAVVQVAFRLAIDCEQISYI